jgi:hypothetical protein
MGQRKIIDIIDLGEKGRQIDKQTYLNQSYVSAGVVGLQELNCAHWIRYNISSLLVFFNYSNRHQVSFFKATEGLNSPTTARM